MRLILEARYEDGPLDLFLEKNHPLKCKVQTAAPSEAYLGKA